jgi:predicted phage terminase large subunit-like protein
VKIVIGQRVHEDDVIGFILDGDPDSSQWVHLCLPARYERNHEYLTAPKRKLPSGREILGDPRTEEGQLLAPEFMDDQTLDQITYDMTELVRQAQYQQRPAPREGNLLKRRLWRYFDPAFLEDENLGSLPTFRMVVASWDTAVKEKTTSDYVVGTAWGFHGADMYLLRLIRQQMSFSSTKTSMKEMRQWVVDRWPNAACYTVIEKASNGVEIIAQLEREIQGVQKYNPGDGGDKTMRAEAALPALESGNCFLPGYQNPEMDGFDARTPAFVQKFVEECAVFNKGKNDDQVDSWSQAVNWARKRGVRDVQVSIPTGSL